MSSTSTTLDLDAQIELAERAVADRDQRVRASALGVVQQVKDHAVRSITIGIGAVAAVFLLFRASRRGPRLARGATAMANSGRRRPVALTRLLALAWPLLPLSLRQRVNPRLMSLLGFGLPILAGLGASAAASREGPVTAINLDLPRYTGRWFEIARLPLKPEAQCESDVSATYTLHDGGIEVINQCLRDDGSAAVVQGEARMTDPENPAKLEVSFAPEWLRWLPVVWSDYWVLYVDADYQCAVVGTPDRKHLWLLARSAHLDGERLRRLIDHARLKGFDTSRLTLTPQQG